MRMSSHVSGKSTISQWPKNSRNRQSAASRSPLRRSRNLRRNGLRSQRWPPLRRGGTRLGHPLLKSKAIPPKWRRLRTRPCPAFHTLQTMKLTKKSYRTFLWLRCRQRNQGRLLCPKANVAAHNPLHPHNTWLKV